MGLKKMGIKTISSRLNLIKRNESDKIIALAGNPNVGKSTVFNALTGLNQHTGNWTGKTVTNAQGYCKFKGQGYVMVDLPGCYSLIPHSAEEEVARDFICNEKPDAVIVVCDAACLERNLNLALQILEITPNVIICVNLMDEAKKKGIDVNTSTLSELLGVPVIGTSARSREGLDILMETINSLPSGISDHYKVIYPNESDDDAIVETLINTAESISRSAVCYKNKSYDKKDRALDKFFTSKLTGFPAMFLVLIVILWITIVGANYPSELIAKGLFRVGDKLLDFFSLINAPEYVSGILVLGIYRVLAWVVSVMLPPMAIFFPLFTLLEDLGYLPRIAFNLDKIYKKCSACGKQALTMCMGFGCNAVGIISCRIIDSPRERLIAVITNNFVPCNGRFPILISIISMFFIGGAVGLGNSILSAILLTSVIVFGIIMTFIISKMLSMTILKGTTSSFTLELPPYRKPQIGQVIVRSIFDRTLFVLGRAVVVAAPAGLVIWLLANITVGGIAILYHCSEFLDPFAKLFGMDGVILLAFVLALPANEIVIPIIIMTYMAQDSIFEIDDLFVLRQLLINNGWTWITAVSVILFSLMHWPCSTTCLTIKKETGSIKWAAISFIVPTVTGFLVCFIFTNLARLIAL